MFANYSKNQCRQECMVKVVVQKCGCWPNSIGVNQKATPPLVNCSFVNHARCVAPLVSNFKQQTHCDCPPKCIQDETVIDSIQYGKYQGGKLIRRDAMLTSIMIYLKPEHRYHRYVWSNLINHFSFQSVPN